MELETPSVYNAINKGFSLLTDYHREYGPEQQYKLLIDTVKADKTLTDYEKSSAERELAYMYDIVKVLANYGNLKLRRICDDCQEQCLATCYCEICIRNYLKTKFLDWTSGNDDIDDLIQKCQMGAPAPNKIIEWIPYDALENVEYLTEGGFSKIYTADWIDGWYQSWDDNKRRLVRIGKQKVILKTLDNSTEFNKNWLSEGKYNLDIYKRGGNIVKCYGLTKNPKSKKYELVMQQMDMDLRTYLRQNHHKLTWKKRIDLIHRIVVALNDIHANGAIHKDLHSGNILLLRDRCQISDLGFCGPVDNDKGKYGILTYMAPELLKEEEYTIASDIYSIAMLMWEVSSGEPPFKNRKHDFNLATEIMKGARPKIVPGTPPEYEKLMKQCWDADPKKRFDDDAKYANKDVEHIFYKIHKMKQSYYEGKDEGNEQQVNNNRNNYTISNSTSKIHYYENLPEPENATEAKPLPLQHNNNVTEPDDTDPHHDNFNFIEAYENY